MKKVWIFVEGDSEEYFVSNLIRKKFYDTISQKKDLSEFLEKKPRELANHLLYCENCGSVDKIPHKINEMLHLIERSGSKDIIIICDVEKLKCPIYRKEEIEKKLDPNLDKFNRKYICFNPMIESAYWECKPIIKKIITLQYKNKFQKLPTKSISLPEKSSYSINDLKESFIKFNLKYRETLFAKEFFPRVNYDQCKNSELQRMINFLNSTLGV